ncbi:uncharacterized protein N7473_002702 [Penicillium subrubescens]|jgi:hypothetical protein|uniref:Uncharacterized protein n=1 Tax=Penicillium subrubescens TaxID=1316194 RepID=A0A1Q5UKT9_9EURO|nr:uncharacterized protein N7473_002702 [Penicillium subrubescens]KAJ5905786.1 hypothetical protein N7473_002702 [Penicillium subrubescens]OKP13105.1 hypothetical protein PENSUB_1205 [Penicillium subrubescens]
MVGQPLRESSAIEDEKKCLSRARLETASPRAHEFVILSAITATRTTGYLQTDSNRFSWTENAELVMSLSSSDPIAALV